MDIMLKITRQTLTISKFAAVLLMVLLLGSCSCKLRDFDPEVYNEAQEFNAYEPEITECEILFTKSEIPEDIRNKMYGVTISDNSIMSFR